MNLLFQLTTVLIIGTFCLTEAQATDTIFMNAKVLTGNMQGVITEAIAIDRDLIIAVGSNEEILKTKTQHTRIIDLHGRTIIPGLIDSHIHAIRGGLSYGRELRWADEKSLATALKLIKDAASNTPKGEWITVIGGWHKSQFLENRLPTPAELEEAAPEHPVYVQYLYLKAILNQLGMKTLALTQDKQLPSPGKIERDAEGNPTGIITGAIPTFTRLFGMLPQPSLKAQVEGSKALFRELNRFGMTGIIDAGGGGMFWRHYKAVFETWKQKQLSLRVRFRVMPQPPHRGKELEIIKSYSQFLPQGFGDDYLKFIGWGEVIIWDMHDGERLGQPFTPKPGAKKALYNAGLWIAKNDYTIEIHAYSDSSANHILDVMEDINKAVPISKLRWVITHLNDGKPDTLKRMKALGISYAVQDGLYFLGDKAQQQLGVDAASKAPPLRTALDLGIVVSGGTDGHRVAPLNPMRSLQWLLDGKSVSGRQIRGASETPNRLEALRIYTLNSAWMSSEEDVRGSLEVGKFADLAVLDKDYLTIPVEKIHSIQSLLTMLGGKIVFAQGPYASLEED